MKLSWFEQLPLRRYLWAAVAGLFLAASFPKLNLAGLAWVAPGALLFAALGRKDAFRIGYVGGFAYGLAAFYWILLIPFPAGAVCGWLALGAYLALFQASWVWICWRTFPQPREERDLLEGPRLGGAETLASTPAFSQLTPGDSARREVRNDLHRFLAVPLLQRVLWAAACAALWVGMEMVLARLFTGFPWNLLGVSQFRILPLIQISSWTGVYGVSFLVAWFSVGLAGACVNLAANPGRAGMWVGDLLLPLLTVAGVVAFGATRLADPHPVERTLRSVLIQPSIPQTLIFDTNQNAIRFTQLVELSERALQETTNAQLLVWPEAAVPNLLRYDFDTYAAVTNLAMKHHVWVILGSDDAVRRENSTELEYDFYNSSFVLDPEGEIGGVYRKRRLVIFGEYIPLEHWLPFMKYLTPVGGSFSIGRQPHPFIIPELHVKTSVLICFEDIFPHGVPEYVEPDTDFLLNLTNNGWFGESAAQWQHAANAVFRAVENRIPLVRCANNGLTCWVDEQGGMHQEYFPNSRDVYGAGFKVVNVPLLAKGEHRALTFYTRHGDWFGWGCSAVAGMCSLAAVRQQLRERSRRRSHALSALRANAADSEPGSAQNHG